MIGFEMGPNDSTPGTDLRQRERRSSDILPETEFREFLNEIIRPVNTGGFFRE
jgi:hypothetical protein